jgi:protocatechuate 3,4-dioxygenase beta subunit
MKLLSFLRSLVGKRRPGKAQFRRSRLSFESLEAREMLASSILSPADCGVSIAGKSQFVLGYFMDIAPAPGSSCTAAASGVLPASISGCVYADLNNDGFMQPGEPGIANVTITLSGVDDMGQQILVPIQTAADGTYSFGNLQPGTYTLTKTPPAGYLDGKDLLGSAGGTSLNNQFALITLGPGTNAVNYKFGELPPASLSGCVYVDANNNGVMDQGEPGIANTTISLTGSDDLGQAVHFVVSTAADGTYNFGHLRPGSYTITETQPNGYFDGKDSLGSAGGNLGNDVFSNILLAPGQNGINYKFGELQGARVSGSVYVDLNDNGVMNASDPGIPGVTITLTGIDIDGSPVSLVQTTAADGSFAFGGLNLGTYTLSETQPTGYLQGKNSVGSAGGTLQGDQISSIVLGSGTAAINYKFGELLPASLKGVVYLDGNDDGVMQANEPGLSGALITLSGTDVNGGAVSQSQTSAADGSFAFTNLLPGTYTLSETPPAGYLDGKDSAGSAGGLVGKNQIGTIHLGAGVDAVNYKFAEILPSGISGFVYVDNSDNGIKDASDPGIGGVTVTLSGVDDLGSAVNQTQTTAADGSYAFVNLRPGTYAVQETQPANYFDGKDTIGALPGKTANDQFSNIVLNSAVNDPNNNFGELLPASIGGCVYVDANGNGVMDPGEPTIPGVTITLAGTDDLGNTVNLVQTTDANGQYNFTNLRPGNYTVTKTPPAGFTDGQISLGNLGGTKGNDQFFIALSQGSVGLNYKFGEILPVVPVIAASSSNDTGGKGQFTL